MKVTILKAKSFTDIQDEYTKTYETGDLEKFFTEEGKNLDRLAMVALIDGKHVKGKLFKVCFDIIVEN